MATHDTELDKFNHQHRKDYHHGKKPEGDKDANVRQAGRKSRGQQAEASALDQ